VSRQKAVAAQYQQVSYTPPAGATTLPASGGSKPVRTKSKAALRRTASVSVPSSAALRSAPVAAREDLSAKIARIALAEGVVPKLFHSLIYAESAYKVNARSYKGAGCLTQLMPDTARRFGLVVDAGRGIDERFSNLDKCLTAGARYLAWLLHTFKGDTRLALAGYNAGEGAVWQYGNRIPPYLETTQYVEKILYYYTGQTGHGVAMAYNQERARRFVQPLYTRGTLKLINRQTAPTANQPNTAPLLSPAAISAAEQNGDTAAGELFFWSKKN
jgi:soluble lytic murein transglycosylase-like protein